jgi:hypothetical protein
MNFEEWLRSEFPNPERLTDERRADMKMAYEAGQRNATPAKPTKSAWGAVRIDRAVPGRG